MKVYYLENWDWIFIYHFFYYSLGGVRHLINKDEKLVLYLPYLVENKHDIDKQMILKITNSTNDIDYPMNKTGVFPSSIVNLYYQMFNCLKDRITVLYTLQDIDLSDIDIVLFHGEHCGCFVPNENPYFLRSLFLPSFPEFRIKPGKRIYITRKNSEYVSRHNGIKKRHLLNEDELTDKLKYLDFEFIQLEDYSFEQKVELFATSEIIISPNGGGLSFIVFANIKTKIIELFPKFELGQYGQTFEANYNHRQFLHVANILKLDYSRFQDMTFIDNELNMKVDIDSFIPFVESKVTSE